MAIILTDKEIDDFVQERKLLPEDYRAKIQMRPKTGHKERELDITGEKGNEFRLILRQSIINPWTFRLYLHIDHRNQTNFFVCAGIMEEATSTPTSLREKNSTISMFIKEPFVTKRLGQMKIHMLSPQTVFPILTKPWPAC